MRVLSQRMHMWETVMQQKARDAQQQARDLKEARKRKRDEQQAASSS